MIYEELNREPNECWRCCVDRIASEISKEAARKAVRDYDEAKEPGFRGTHGDEQAAFSVLSDLELTEVWDDESIHDL